MTNALIETEGYTTPKLVEEYRWITQDGQHLRPCIMRTGHLFYSVMMLWHHRMPADAKMFEYRRHRLGSRFTDEFCEITVRIMMAELAARDDLTKWQTGILERMAKYLREKTELIPNGRIQLLAT